MKTKLLVFSTNDEFYKCDNFSGYLKFQNNKEKVTLKIYFRGLENELPIDLILATKNYSFNLYTIKYSNKGFFEKKIEYTADNIGDLGVSFDSIIGGYTKSQKNNKILDVNYLDTNCGIDIIQLKDLSEFKRNEVQTTNNEAVFNENNYNYQNIIWDFISNLDNMADIKKISYSVKNFDFKMFKIPYDLLKNTDNEDLINYIYNPVLCFSSYIAKVNHLLFGCKYSGNTIISFIYGIPCIKDSREFMFFKRSKAFTWKGKKDSKTEGYFMYMQNVNNILEKIC